MFMISALPNFRGILKLRAFKLLTLRGGALYGQHKIKTHTQLRVIGEKKTRSTACGYGFFYYNLYYDIKNVPCFGSEPNLNVSGPYGKWRTPVVDTVGSRAVSSTSTLVPTVLNTPKNLSHVSFGIKTNQSQRKSM